MQIESELQAKPPSYIAVQERQQRYKRTKKQKEQMNAKLPKGIIPIRQCIHKLRAIPDGMLCLLRSDAMGIAPHGAKSR